MASPMEFFIVPGCEHGLAIEQVEETRDHVDASKPMEYFVKNTEVFNFGSIEITDKVFKCTLSPPSSITLPKRVRELAGIPSKSTRYSYMHPPIGLAASIDWADPFKASFDDHPKFPQKSAGSGANLTKSEDDNQNSIKYLLCLGGFVYFDENMEIISINALSLEKTDYSLKLSGPWNANSLAVNDLKKTGRMVTIPLQVFHEAGFVSTAWVEPGETFHSEPLTEEAANSNGAMVFVREDGSGVAFMVVSETAAYPKGQADFVRDAVHSTMIAFADKNTAPSFVNEHIGQYDIDKWSKTVDSLAKQLNSRNNKTDNSKIVTALRQTLRDEWTLVHKACHAKWDTSFVRLLLEESIERENLVTKDRFGWLPLYYACRFSASNFDLIKLLLDHNENAVHLPDRCGRYPLHLACTGDATKEVIDLLISSFPSALNEKTNIMKLIPLHVACNRNISTDALKTILDHDATKTAVKESTLTGRLPLHIAVDQKMHYNGIDALLEQGYEDDVYVPVYGMLPIHIACINGSSTETVALLLRKDKKYGEKSTIDYRYNDEAGMSRTRLRTTFEHSETIFSVGNMTMKTPLHIAIKYASAGVIRLILQKEKKIKRSTIEDRTIFQKQRDGKVPLHLACHENAGLDVVQQLLDLDDAKKSLHFRDQRGMKPIHYACNKSDADPRVVEALIQADLRNAAEYSKHKYLRTEEEIKVTGAENGDHGKALSFSTDNRRRIPLYCAVKARASCDVIAILTRKETFNLKNFDDFTIANLGREVNSSSVIQEHIIDILSERCYFTVLFLELYANIAAIVAFIGGTERILTKRILSNVEPTVICICIAAFALRELAQIKSQGFHYIKDVWSWHELTTTYLLAISVVHMNEYQIWYKDQEMEDFKLDRQLMIATGLLLITQIIFYCRSTFLPFARFVGGLLTILTTLIPFFVVSSLLLLVFTYSFRVSARKYGENGDACESIGSCFLFTLQGFFSGSDDTSDPLDVIFGVVAIVILLNVVVAIVGDAWDSATERASSLFWTFRVSYLHESRIFAIIQRKFMNQGFLAILGEKIDRMPNLVIDSNVAWSKDEYSSVTSKEQYDLPELWFDKKFASKVRKARSLKSDLYWAKLEGKRLNDEMGKNGCNGYGTRTSLKLGVTAKFVAMCLVYISLIVLGIFTGGWFWPANFRKGVLSLGIGEDKKDQMDNGTDEVDAVAGKAA